VVVALYFVDINSILNLTKKYNFFVFLIVIVLIGTDCKSALSSYRVQKCFVISERSGYLTGNADVEMDKATLQRIQEVSKLNEKEKDYIFVTLDALIRDFKTKHSFGIAQ
jgi:hypothetical protein